VDGELANYSEFVVWQSFIIVNNVLFVPNSFYIKKQKCKAIPVQCWTGPEGSRKIEAPRFHDSTPMKVVRLSAIHTGCIYLPANISGTHFC
jgi:hypothetical protein